MTNVLIVEDHVSMRESLTTALTAAGDFSVVGEVPNADYALDFCKHLHPELVLMDVCTEGGASGLKAVEAIRKTDPEVKIIVMTAFDEITYIPRARAAGANGFIYKSRSLHDFLEVIHQETRNKAGFCACFGTEYFVNAYMYGLFFFLHRCLGKTTGKISSNFAYSNTFGNFLTMKRYKFV